MINWSFPCVFDWYTLCNAGLCSDFLFPGESLGKNSHSPFFPIPQGKKYLWGNPTPSSNHKTLQKSGDETKKPNVNNGARVFLWISHDHIFLAAGGVLNKRQQKMIQFSASHSCCWTTTMTNKSWPSVKRHHEFAESFYNLHKMSRMSTCASFTRLFEGIKIGA